MEYVYKNEYNSINTKSIGLYWGTFFSIHFGLIKTTLRAYMRFINTIYLGRVVATIH